MKRLYLFLIIGLLSSCSTDTTQSQASDWAKLKPQDILQYSGEYHWDFNLMGGRQNSTHVFYQDSITYSMKGIVYETNYTMNKLSFDASVGKWIGMDQDGVVYVLFFKNQADTALLIYKHKCSDNGLEEADRFLMPDIAATEDHGWNLYSKNRMDVEDRLVIHDSYVRDDTIQIAITDSLVTLNKQSYNKKSYHAGERRWMGVSNDHYLLLFWDDSTSHTINLYIEEGSDLEKLYKTKHHQIKTLTYERK